MNLNSILNKKDQKILKWKSTSLTQYERAIAANVSILSRIWFAAQEVDFNFEDIKNSTKDYGNS